MKNILALSTCLALTLSAYAGPWTDPILNGGTNNVLAATTNVYEYTTNLFAMSYGTDISIGIAYRLDGAGVSTNDFTFDVSLDHTNWFTNAIVVPTVSNGTNLSYTIYEYHCGAIEYIRTGTIANTNASVDLTNVDVEIGAVKIGVK